MTDQFYDRLSNACHELLLGNEDLLEYLNKDRGISVETIRKYKIGSFPGDLRILFKYIDPQELRENSIIWNAERSAFKLYPIVIPINDVSGKSVAIGCRTLLSDEKRDRLGIPKYRNSEYHKTSYLFGLDKAIKSIRENNCAYVVEGYFDQITASQHGIDNVVATCGTLFSIRQYMMLSRYTDNIKLLFDNDEPGRESSKRVNKRLEKFDKAVDCLFTPDGFNDLDEYLLSGGDFSLIR